MGRGFSLTAFAGSIGVCGETVRQWQHDHPQFSAAVKRARCARLQFLESRLFNAESAPQVTSSIFALKCTDREEWGDVQRTELTGKNGGPVEIDNLSDAELLAIAARGKRN